MLMESTAGASWSLSPCYRPCTYLRAELVRCPGPGAICLKLVRNTVNLSVVDGWAAPIAQLLLDIRLLLGSVG